jgi:hypothetical protein
VSDAYGGGVLDCRKVARHGDAAGFTDRSQLLVGTG